MKIYLITLVLSLLPSLVFPKKDFSKKDFSKKETFIKVLMATGSKTELQSLIQSIRFNNDHLFIDDKKITAVGGDYYYKTKKSLIINKNKYRGHFAFIKSKKRPGEYLFIIKLPIEDYIGGVLKGEISTSWPLESINAQAIASRTYAHWMIQNKKSKIYDIKSSVSHQVFKGNVDVHPHFKKALIKTKGIILTHRNEPIQTFFTAACGGETEKPKYVWSSTDQLTYFQNIRCPYCTTHPKYQWRAKMSLSTIEQKLNRRQKLKKNHGRIKSVRVSRRSPSGRALVIEITTSQGRVNLSGNAFRLAIGGTIVQSLRFKLNQRKNHLYFTGRGYGHGVGLCQWGAKTMAERGYSYQRILKFYYKQSRLKQSP